MNLRALSSMLLLANSLTFLTGLSKLSQHDFPEACSKQEYKPCPNRWEYVEGARTCVSVETTQLEHTKAEEHCQIKQAKLISILNVATQEDLVELLENTGNGSFWVGMNYQSASAGFRWNGVASKPSYTRNSLSSKEGNCVSISMPSGQWEARQCSDTIGTLCVKTEFEEKPTKPRVKIATDAMPNKVAIGVPYHAVCTGAVGGAGQLFLRYSVDRALVDVSYVDFSQYRSYKGYRRDRQGKCHRHEEVVVAVSVNVQVNDTSRLICFVGDAALGPSQKMPTISQQSNVCSTCAVAVVLHNYFNTKPSLDVQFHEAPNVLHLFRDVEVVCAACTGLHGNVSLLLYDRKQRPSESPIPANQQRNEYASKQKACGTYVIHKMYVEVTAFITNKSFLCQSYMHPSATSSRKDGIRKAFSPLIHTLYGPQQPTIYVNYPVDKDLLLLETNLTANCTACVGRIGNISWSLLDVNNRPFDDSELQKLHLKVLNSTEYTSWCGNTRTSTISFRVRETLQGAQLLCSSYAHEYLPGVDLFATSGRLNIKGVSSVRSAPHDFFPFFFLGLFSLATLVILHKIWKGKAARTVSRPRPQREKSKEKHAPPGETDIVSDVTVPAVSTSMMRLRAKEAALLGGEELEDELPTDLEVAEKMRIPVSEARKRLKEIKDLRQLLGEAKLKKLRHIEPRASISSESTSSPGVETPSLFEQFMSQGSAYLFGRPKQSCSEPTLVNKSEVSESSKKRHERHLYGGVYIGRDH